MDSLQLTVTLNPNGSVTVSGPLANKVLCYGMLEGAMDVVRSFTEKAAEQQKAEAEKAASNGAEGSISLVIPTGQLRVEGQGLG